MGSHNLNKTSTRSHCIMTLLLEGRHRDEDGSLGPVRYGRLSLVDLAGEILLFLLAPCPLPLLHPYRFKAPIGRHRKH